MTPWLALDLLQSPPVGREPLVERDGVALLIFPVGDARGDLPVLLLLHRHLPCRRVHHRRRRGRRPPRDLRVDLEPDGSIIHYTHGIREHDSFPVMLSRI